MLSFQQAYPFPCFCLGLLTPRRHVRNVRKESIFLSHTINIHYFRINVISCRIKHYLLPECMCTYMENKINQYIFKSINIAKINLCMCVQNSDIHKYLYVYVDMYVYIH